MDNSGKIAFAVVLAVKLLASVAYGQPVISDVSNAASYIFPPLPGSSIAQGSFFVVLDSGSAPSGVLADWGAYPLPTSLGGTSIATTVGAVTTNAFMLYVGPSWGSSGTQIDAVLPSSTPTGAGTVVITQNGITSAPFPITVVSSSPGTFSLNGSGTGPGTLFNVASDGSLTQNSLFNAATPGQTITLYATGLGPANPAQEGDHPPAQKDVRNSNFLVDVWVGNQQATVQYAGRSSYTAEDLINFVVPAGLSGCYNDVAVYAGPPGNQTVSNFTTLAVAAGGGICSDADGINMADLLPAIASKGSVNVGAIGMFSDYLSLAIADVLTLEWDYDTVNGEIATLTTQQLNASLGFMQVPSVNSCAVIPFLEFSSQVLPDPVLNGVFGPVAWLDAGPNLTIDGPNGTKAVPQNASGQGYGALVGGATVQQLLTGGGLPPFFLDSSFAILPGIFTVAGPGGPNVGAFSAGSTVSPAAATLSWTNQSSVTSGPISRNTPLTVTWGGGDPNGFVEIVATASTAQSSAGPTPTTPGSLIECIAPASAGTFTIPVYVLQSLPSTANSQSFIPPGYLQVGPSSGAIKIPTPSGLDAAYLFYHYIQGVNVVWQ